MLFVLVAVPACNSFRKTDGSVAAVGSVEIERRLIDTRSRLFTGNKDVPDPQTLALAQLILGQLSSQVLAHYGRTPTDGTILECWSNVAEQLPDPYKTVTFALSDVRLWIDAIVFPVCSATLLEEFFKNDPAADRELRGRAVALHRQLHGAPERFERIAEDEHLRIDHLWVGKETLRVAGRDKEPKDTAPRPYSDDEKQQAAELYGALRDTRPGEVYGRIINTPDAMQIIKVEERRQDLARIAVLIFPKKSMELWFWNVAGKIPVAIHDPKLKDKFVKSVAWAKKVKWAD